MALEFSLLPRQQAKQQWQAREMGDGGGEGEERGCAPEQGGKGGRIFTCSRDFKKSLKVPMSWSACNGCGKVGEEVGNHLATLVTAPTPPVVKSCICFCVCSYLPNADKLPGHLPVHVQRSKATTTRSKFQ